MIRFFIVVIVYSLAVIGLPRWAPFNDLMQALLRIPPTTALMINAGAVILAGGLFFVFARKPNGLFHKYPSGFVEIIRFGLIGVLFAGVFDLLQGVSGYAATVEGLAIIPIAFIVAEVVYVALRWALRRFTNRQSTDNGPANIAAEHSQSETNQTEENSFLRLLITIPIYAFVILFLPRQEDFRRLSETLINISPLTAVILSWVALAIALAGAMWAIHVVQENPPILTGDPVQDEKAYAFAEVKSRVYISFWIGLAFAALINIAGYFVSYAPSVTYLIVIPIGTFLAELTYQLLAWRIKYGPPEI